MFADAGFRAWRVATGLVLGLIGLRFGLVPRSAARFFGLDTPAAPAHVHYVVAVRDLWLALLVIALAALKEWRALALWLGLAALACLADAVIVMQATGWMRAILFHVASGLDLPGACDRLLARSCPAGRRR